MEKIIAGRFHTKAEADTVADALGEFVPVEDICIFHNNPPGQHDALPAGGDEDADPQAKGAGGSSIEGAIAGGLAAGAVGALGGPVVALAAAGVGAYTGSLVGAVEGLGHGKRANGDPDRRPAGIMLAVRIGSPKSERVVIAALRKGRADDIEQAQGTWTAGDWVDFDPVSAPHLL
jgi:hypothetical protein